MTEEEINQLKIKAEKWDALEERISDFYANESDDPEESGGLITLGLIAVTAFGYL